MKIAILSLCALGLSASVWANGSVGPFTEKKGVQEFTGMMIARPVQRAELLKLGLSESAITQVRTRAIGRLSNMRLRYYSSVDEMIIKVPSGLNESTLSDQLMKTGDYQYVVPNWRVWPVGKVTPNDPQFANQWHHKTIHSEEAWGVGTGTSNVTIAVVDTGVMITHPDLKDSMVSGYNSVDRKAQSAGGQVVDINGHGTHVAGDAAARGNNNIGVVGEGWRFKIMPVRTSNDPSGGATIDDITAGARWAIENGAKVASASYSGVDDPTVGTTGTYIKSRGGLFLYAAGNDNRNLSGFSYPDTIVCGASAENDKKAGFSAYGRGVSVFAPGNNILSTTSDGGYGYASGTSMATPVTNGAVALIWSINPDLEPNEVQQILYTTCDNIGPSSVYGNGRINLYQAALKSFQSRGVGVHVTPLSLSLRIGKFVSGSLANISTGTGNGYTTQSTFIQQVGAATVVELKFKPGVKATEVNWMEPTYTVSGPVGVSPTVQLYIYNNTTKSFELLKSSTMDSSGSLMTMTSRIRTGFVDYLGADGSVRTVLRVLSPMGRRGQTWSHFKSKISFGELLVRKIVKP